MEMVVAPKWTTRANQSSVVQGQRTGQCVVASMKPVVMGIVCFPDIDALFPSFKTDYNSGCGEGATCTSDGQCMPATLTWDDVEDGLEVSQISNIHRHIFGRILILPCSFVRIRVWVRLKYSIP